MAKIFNSILEAKKTGASDDQIIDEIIKQNPSKAPSFQKAFDLGASSSQVLNEVIKQNKPKGAAFFERLGLSFAERGKGKEFEEAIGKRGKFDVGDIADVAGAIPSLGGFLGGAALGTAIAPGIGTVIGGALGAGGGELLKQLTGKAIGKRKEFEPGEIALETIFAGVGGVAGKAISPIAKTLSRTMPRRLVQSLIKQTPKEIQAGKDITEFVLKKPFTKTSGGLLNESIANQKVIGGQIKNILKSPGLSKQLVRPQNLYQQVADSFPQSGLDAKSVETIIRGRAQIVGKTLGRKKLSLTEANEIRSIIDSKVLKSRAFLTQELPFNQDIVKAFNRLLREEVKSKAPGTRALFDEFSKEITFSSNLERVIAQKGRNQILSVGDILPGTIGGVAGGFPGVLAGVAGRRIAGSAPGKLGLAKLLKGTGGIVERGLQIPGAERGAGLGFFETLRKGRDFLR